MLVRVEYFDGRIPIRVPLQPIDAESELERLNACLQEAHGLSESIRRTRGRLFLMPNWRYLRSLHHRPHAKSNVSTTTNHNKRHHPSDGLRDSEDITYKSYTPITVSSSSSDRVRVTGFPDPKTNQFVTALLMMDKRERFRGCLGLFWREERQRMEDFDLQELREANEAFSSFTHTSSDHKRACITTTTAKTTPPPTTTSCGVGSAAATRFD